MTRFIFWLSSSNCIDSYQTFFLLGCWQITDIDNRRYYVGAEMSASWFKNLDWTVQLPVLFASLKVTVLKVSQYKNKNVKWQIICIYDLICQISHCPKLRKQRKQRQATNIYNWEAKTSYFFWIFCYRTINGFSELMQIYFFVGCLTEKLTTFFSSAFKKT